MSLFKFFFIDAPKLMTSASRIDKNEYLVRVWDENSPPYETRVMVFTKGQIKGIDQAKDNINKQIRELEVA